MKVLITGANGFIGSKLLSFFSDKGHETIGVDICSNSSNVIKADLSNLLSIEDVLSNIKPDIIVHCAGNASVPISVQDPLTDLNRNVIVTETLLLAMKNTDCHSRLVFLSSAGVYGNQEVVPFVETMIPKPLSPYALHKYFCEQMCLYYVRNYSFDIKIVRIFSAYGPGLRKQIFWDMSEKIKNIGKLNLGGTGNEERDFIYIEDLIEALYIVSISSFDDCIINVASGKATKIKDIASIFAKLHNLSNDVICFSNVSREGDPISMEANIDKLKSLGFEPKTGIEAGIKQYVEWYQSKARTNFE